MGYKKHAVSPESDKSSRPPAVNAIICWKCSREIPLSHAGDRCPLCGAILSEQAYEERAGALLFKQSDLGTQIGMASEQLASAKERNARLGLLRNLPFLPSRRLITRLESSISSMRQESQQISASLKHLAVARYYVSRWYRHTGWTLCDLGRPGSSPFGSPRFALGRKGTVRFTCKPAHYPQKLSGYLEACYAEYLTFCEIQRVVDTGALGCARLLANLVIDYDDDELQRYNKHVRAHEIDAVLVTERAVVTIETKRTWMSVTADYDSRRRRHRIIRTKVNNSGEPYGLEQEDRSVGQIVSHCHTLLQTGIYSIDRPSVVGLVVYAGTPHLNVRCEQGSGRPPIFLASLESHGPSLEEVLRTAVLSCEVKRSAAEVDAVADELFACYADLDGTKLRAHRERIARDALVRRAPTISPKRRSLGAPGNDKELERMLAELRSSR